MGVYAMGEFLREARVRKGYTQEELCFGICTHGNLSKIENGQRRPCWKTFEALLERLGITSYIYPGLLCEEELFWYNLKYKTLNGFGLGFGAGYDGLREYVKNKDGGGHPLQEQLVQTAAAMLKYCQGGDPKKIQEMLWQALHITAPHFKGAVTRGNWLFTNIELFLILCLGQNAYAIKLKQQGIEMLFLVKEYIESKMAESDIKIRLYSVTLSHLSLWLCEQRRFQDSVSLSEFGIKYCIRYGSLLGLPLLLASKGRSLAELGHKREAQKYLMRARVIFEMMDCQEMACSMKEYLEGAG